MKILAFTVMSRLRRRTPRYKFRKVHAKIPRGRTQRTSTSTYGSLASLLLCLPFFFSSFRTETSVQSSLHHMLRDINGWKKKTWDDILKMLPGTGRIKIMSLISRSLLAINASRGEVFIGKFSLFTRVFPADVMAQYY